MPEWMWYVGLGLNVGGFLAWGYATLKVDIRERRRACAWQAIEQEQMQRWYAREQERWERWDQLWQSRSQALDLRHPDED